MLDVQWPTPHLRSLGAVEVSRERYLDALADAVERDPTAARKSALHP
jgi:Leu/Phe-tRNA-protein transferase